MPRPNPTEDELKMMLGRGGAKEHGGVGGGVMERDSPISPTTGTTHPVAARNSRKLVANPAHAPLIITLRGQLCSGKNQVQMLWRNGRIHKYPNKTFTNWRSRSHIQIEEQQLPAVRTQTITVPVILTCQYTPGDLRTRDITGQLDAIFHLLVYAKVLKDDGLVHEVHWTRLPMNRKAPQITLTITEVA